MSEDIKLVELQSFTFHLGVSPKPVACPVGKVAPTHVPLTTFHCDHKRSPVPPGGCGFLCFLIRLNVARFFFLFFGGSFSSVSAMTMEVKARGALQSAVRIPTKASLCLGQGPASLEMKTISKRITPPWGRNEGKLIHLKVVLKNLHPQLLN